MIRRRTITSYVWNSVSGNKMVILSNCIRNFFRKLELIGNSVQLTTTGKNLINNNIYTHGYLASVDTGQKISLNTEAKSFTTSMDVSSMVGENISISVQTKEETGKKYAFTDESDTIISGKWDTGSNTYSKFQNIQVPQNAKKLYFSVTYDVQENTELQVELGAKVTTYEPYTGGKPSPSPEYPQEIKNAGRKSKNLFDINYFKDKSNLKMLQCEGFTLLGIICNVKPNTEYTLSANLSEAKYNLNIANKATRFSLTSSPTRTLISNDDGTLYIGFYGATADNVNMDDFMQQYQNIQLEERTVATDYEPYGHFLEMKITGKNLFNAEKAKDANNWTSSAILPSYKEFSIYVGKGNSVNISYLENLETGLGFYANIAHSKNDYTMYWLYHSDSEINITKNKNFIAMNDYIVLRVDAGSVPKFLSI